MAPRWPKTAQYRLKPAPAAAAKKLVRALAEMDKNEDGKITYEEYMRSLLGDGKMKILRGVTTPVEVARFAQIEGFDPSEIGAA